VGSSHSSDRKIKSRKPNNTKRQVQVLCYQLATWAHAFERKAAPIIEGKVVPGREQTNKVGRRGQDKR
jgi:hypothetical protein